MTVAEMVNSSRYSSLDIEYFQYPPDVNLRCWFQKQADVLTRIQTKFVIQADNDDFILFNALEDSIEKAQTLSAITNYSRPHFRIRFETRTPRIEERIYPTSEVWVRKLQRPKNAALLANGSPYLRLSETLTDLGYAPFIWYGIWKTQDLQSIHQRIFSAEFSLAMFQEFFLTYGATLKGPCIIEEGPPFCVRQEETSTGAASMYPKERLDYIYMQPSWSRDLEVLLDILFIEFQASGGCWDSERFRQHVAHAIWLMAREKTRYTYWADKIKTRYSLDLYNRWKTRFQKRNYVPIDEAVGESLDGARLRHFLQNAASLRF